MKLQSMVEFVLLQKETSTLDTAQIDWYDLEVNILSKIRKYALFISRSPTLEMFVPVDQDGNVLEEPMQEKYGWYSSCSPEEESGWMHPEGKEKYFKALEQWQNSKEKVLFEGFKYTGIWGGFWELRHISGQNFSVRRDGTGSIEKLLLRNVDIELTTYALKQFSS